MMKSSSGDDLHFCLFLFYNALSVPINTNQSPHLEEKSMAHPIQVGSGCVLVSVSEGHAQRSSVPEQKY